MKSGVGNAIVDVANRDTVELEVIEDVKLSVSIRFDGAVIIEMIASNIREAGGVEREPGGPIFGEGDGGKLDNGAYATVFHHRFQDARELLGVGSRLAGRRKAFSVVNTKRADQSNAHSRFGQDASQDVRQGGFPSGASHGDESHFPPGISAQGLTCASVDDAWIIAKDRRQDAVESGGDSLGTSSIEDGDDRAVLSRGFNVSNRKLRITIQTNEETVSELFVRFYAARSKLAIVDAISVEVVERRRKRERNPFFNKCRHLY